MKRNYLIINIIKNWKEGGKVEKKEGKKEEKKEGKERKTITNITHYDEMLKTFPV